MYINFHPEIKSNDFSQMREHYKDYLRFHNYDDESVNNFLNDFDVALENKDYENIYKWMSGIGVILIEEGGD